ncbi:hypothetical protein DSO57_1037618 [Entomophthora muscae]|uniref:Uncharacterized protein n=2 Tax=Entomophthora muscae TaxID=34485 RepID=A0ACC2RDL1_9FUNG|nr:hypothetical protein DSO57_1037617 [Entomophthora muscae]KAJ9048181.1 hypothetical protein DSO57_1037618 [Entomophthora muscae]
MKITNTILLVAALVNAIPTDSEEPLQESPIAPTEQDKAGMMDAISDLCAQEDASCLRRLGFGFNRGFDRGFDRGFRRGFNRGRRF